MAFPIDKSCIDKSLPVPVGVQLRGLLAYVISHGDMAFGARLPSVRDLATELGLATMTVNQVYKQLRDAGLIEIRAGLGAFVARDPTRLLGAKPRAASLRKQVDGLLDQAADMGISPEDLVSLVNAQIQVRRLRTALRILFVGVFAGPAREYVDEIRPYLSTADEIEITTFDALRADSSERKRAADAVCLVPLVHREVELRAIMADGEIVTLRFNPSEATRRALAGLDPRSRIVAVTAFEEYIAIMRPSIQRFAPHVSQISITSLDASNLQEMLREGDVVVYATGAHRVIELIDPAARAFEYRHAPDHGEIERFFLPYLSERRGAKVAAASRIVPFKREAPQPARRKAGS